MPMQKTEIQKIFFSEGEFFISEKKNHSKNNFDFLNVFAQNKHCEYSLEPPQRGGSNEYPQCMFWIKNKKIRYTPANPSFLYYKNRY